MRKTFFILASMICVLHAEPAYAGPGGMIAKAVEKTLLGKIVFCIFAFVFMPLIIWFMITEHLAEKRARKDLKFMAAYSPLFDWLKIRERAKDCFYRIHASWENEDLTTASDWMSPWYWQNQQLTSLERWKREGLQNICEVRKISAIRPLLFVHKNEGKEHEDSMIVISITANMKDYLEDRETGEVVEGCKKIKSVETVWSFTLIDGNWKVSDISESSTSISFAKLRRDLPQIETTLETGISV